MEYSTYLSVLLPGVYGVLDLPFRPSPWSICSTLPTFPPFSLEEMEYSTYRSALLPRVDVVLYLPFRFSLEEMKLYLPFRPSP